MFTTAAIPRPPRLDAKLLFLVAVLLASGLTFFAVCADAHAAVPALRVNGLQFAEQDEPPTVTHAVLWSNGASLKWHMPDGRDETVAGPEVFSRLPESVIVGMKLADEQIRGHKLATKDDLSALLYLDGLAAVFGAMVGAAGCAWAMRRYALVGLRTRRWVSRATRSLEQRQLAAIRSTYR